MRKNSEGLNPRLNPFFTDNGYNPAGASHYSDEFKSRYFRAQPEQMNRLIADALELLQRMETGKHIYTEDAPFNIPKFDGARLRFVGSQHPSHDADPREITQERRQHRN